MTIIGVAPIYFSVNLLVLIKFPSSYISKASPGVQLLSLEDGPFISSSLTYPLELVPSAIGALYTHSPLDFVHFRLGVRSLGAPYTHSPLDFVHFPLGVHSLGGPYTHSPFDFIHFPLGVRSLGAPYTHSPLDFVDFPLGVRSIGAPYTHSPLDFVHLHS